MKQQTVNEAVVQHLAVRELNDEPAPGLYDLHCELGAYDTAAVERRRKVKGFLQQHGLNLLADKVSDYGRVPLWKVARGTTRLLQEGAITAAFDESTDDMLPRRRYYLPER